MRATLGRQVSHRWSDAVSKLVVGCLRYSRDVRLTSERAARLLGPRSSEHGAAVFVPPSDAALPSPAAVQVETDPASAIDAILSVDRGRAGPASAPPHVSNHMEEASADSLRSHLSAATEVSVGGVANSREAGFGGLTTSAHSPQFSTLNLNINQLSTTFSQHHAFLRCCQMESLEAYDMGTRLGRGTFGTVYLVTRKTDGHTACVKKLEFCPGKPTVGEPSFEREVETLRSVQHPNVVKVLGWDRPPVTFDGDEDGYRPWILLEYCSQGSLKGFIDRAKKAGATRLGVEEEQVVRWVKDVLSALTELHSSGIMHRDLKPANVVVHASGVAKVCDFGVAASSEHTRQTHAGTPQYMAPQIACGDGYKADADMYSVGVMVLEMFTLSRIPDTQAQGGDRSSDISTLLRIWYRQFPDIARQNEDALHDDVRATLGRQVSRQWSEAVSKLVVGCLRYSQADRLTSKAAALLVPSTDY